MSDVANDPGGAGGAGASSDVFAGMASGGTKVVTGLGYVGRVSPFDVETASLGIDMADLAASHNIGRPGLSATSTGFGFSASEVGPGGGAQGHRTRFPATMAMSDTETIRDYIPPTGNGTARRGAARTALDHVSTELMKIGLTPSPVDTADHRWQ